jgi:hypothetical protein
MNNTLNTITMKNSIPFALLLAAALMTLSCEKEEIQPLTISGEGAIVTQSLELDPFTSVEFKGVSNLYISNGSEQSVTLKAQQNIIDVLTWEVSASTLSIGLQEGISLNNHEEIRFVIVLPAFNSLYHDGVGEVYIEGNIQDELSIDFRGIGLVNAYDLTVDECMVITSGTGDCRVKVNSYLKVDISAMGNVYYKGNPQINITDTGLGELINDN